MLGLGLAGASRASATLLRRGLVALGFAGARWGAVPLSQRSATRSRCPARSRRRWASVAHVAGDGGAVGHGFSLYSGQSQRDVARPVWALRFPVAVTWSPGGCPHSHCGTTKPCGSGAGWRSRLSRVHGGVEASRSGGAGRCRVAGWRVRTTVSIGVASAAAARAEPCGRTRSTSPAWRSGCRLMCVGRRECRAVACGDVDASARARSWLFHSSWNTAASASVAKWWCWKMSRCGLARITHHGVSVRVASGGRGTGRWWRSCRGAASARACAVMAAARDRCRVCRSSP